jgi:hypothetical protein
MSASAAHPPIVMMRDILLKTVFRKNVENASDIAAAVALPTPLAQELIDMLREMGLMQATGTLHATSSNEMGYQLTDAARRARSMRCRSRNTTARCRCRWRTTRNRSSASRSERPDHPRHAGGAMGHLILPEGMIDQLGPAVTSGARS